MSRQTVDITQWNTDRTQPPVIVWVYAGYWELQPVAVDDTHDCDIYQEYASAFYAASAYQTAEELEEEALWMHGLKPESLWTLYQSGDGSAERLGLPSQWYVEGASPEGSDVTIYVDPVTFAESRRETLEEATPYLDPESVAEIYQEMLIARAEGYLL